MEVITLEIDDDGRGRLQFELPADATAEEVAYIESLVPRIETGLLELRDPGTGEVVEGRKTTIASLDANRTDVQKQIYGQPGGCNVVGFESGEACANLSGVMMGRLVPAPR
jgi:hypothetical protein